MGNPVTAHWGFPDPSQVQGTDAEKRSAFKAVMRGLLERIQLLADLPLDQLDQMSIQAKERELAKT